MRGQQKSERNWLTRYLITVVFLTILSGCTTTPQIMPSEPYQENLLTKCPEQLPRLKGVSGKDIAEVLLKITPQYAECAARHNQLIDEINQRKEMK